MCRICYQASDMHEILHEILHVLPCGFHTLRGRPHRWSALRSPAHLPRLPGSEPGLDRVAAGSLGEKTRWQGKQCSSPGALNPKSARLVEEVGRSRSSAPDTVAIQEGGSLYQSLVGALAVKPHSLCLRSQSPCWRLAVPARSGSHLNEFGKSNVICGLLFLLLLGCDKGHCWSKNRSSNTLHVSSLLMHQPIDVPVIFVREVNKSESGHQLTHSCFGTTVWHCRMTPIRWTQNIAALCSEHLLKATQS